MSFPVDILDSCSHEDLEKSGEDYLTDLRCLSRSCTETLSLPNHGNVSIRLETVGFVPLYGEEEKHKVLGLFIPRNSLTAVALYLADRWWPIDDILRTSVTTRQGLQKVKSVGERIVLYVLNRIIYRTREMERNEIPFLCHGSNDYAKIMWEKGEAIGFYSVKPKGTNCSTYRHQSYKLSVIDTMFVRKKHRETHFGLIMLEDFVDSFKEATLGLRYPLSSFMHTACKQYLEKYPEDNNLLWEVEGAGSWFQRTSIMSALQKGKLKIAGAPQRENESSQAEGHLHQSVALSEASEQETELKNKSNVVEGMSKSIHKSTHSHHSSIKWKVFSLHSELHIVRIGLQFSFYIFEISTRFQLPMDMCSLIPLLEPPAHTPVSTEELVEVPEKSTVDEVEIRVAENEGQAVSEANQHVPPSEKQSEEVTPSEPLNGEVTEGTGRPSHTGEEEIANQVQSGESELQAENQDLVTLFVPIIVEPQAKPSENTVSEEVLNASASEMPTEETTEVEQGTVEQQESETTASESAAASASKEEPSGNGLPNSMVTEAAEESVSENVSPKTASSLEDQNEEAGHNSQEAPVALSQSSLIVVELEGFSFQQPSGQEEQKNQLESSHLEPAEQMDQRMQTVAERAADSSSEEAEIEVPVVDRRNLRRKAKSCKGPPKKKGKPS
ncbi:Soluble lamin-associated protein of 75 kDa [Tyto alba]|uniref:Soluble lamin-associated protein of 75 kDa n=1 Tax=Tyto alba TaxID=56313 RepID=A0A093GTJ8_TYTAL|nr:Soluble lamin-associated protein of 75 kDa [Tyto alba]